MQELGITDIEVTIKEISDEEACNIAFIDNEERNQLDPIEQALHFSKMITEYGYKTKSNDKSKSLADIYGIDQSLLTRKMQLLDLPSQIMTWLKENSQNYDLNHN